MKNNKGVSLISLIITIVVMVILASIALSSANQDHAKAEESRRLAERNQVQQAISVRYGNYLRSPVHNPLLGDDIPTDYATINEAKEYIMEYLTNSGKIHNFETREIVSRQVDDFLISCFSYMEYTRILHHNDIIGLDIDNISKDAIFIVNYSTGSVIGPIG